ncbi:MAG TPA: polysaccharide biosynthesis/export family protein [Gemmatimonadales bacterium]|nr:polysaccharide biosynthesis/export family protein [Gemmatimonadales bacterium]
MIRTTLVVMGAALLLSSSVVAQQQTQQPSDSAVAARLTVTRDTLQAILQRIDSAGGSDTTKGDQKQRALAQQIRARMTRGDFLPGDRIKLVVDSEPQLSDTFPVGPSQELVLPIVGVISLHGVLRSELQAAMTRELGRFLREPIVRATPLIRLSIAGEVARPGYYMMSPTEVLSDVVTAAGGTTQNAEVEKMYVQRGDNRLYEGNALQGLISEGRTLDEASIRPGDKFVIPTRNTDSVFYTVRTISILLSIPLTIYALTQVFKK